MKKGAPYKKLPGLGQQIATYTRLYLGPDHLLQVSTSGFTERYKRFYFRDIQAILLVRTQAWVWWIAACGGIGALMLFIALLADDTVATWFLSIFAGLLLAAAASNALRGPSCRCFVRTAVQTERLPSLSRIRRADKVLGTLKPLIDSAQGPIAAQVAVEQPAFTEPAGDRIDIIPPEEQTPTQP